MNYNNNDNERIISNLREEKLNSYKNSIEELIDVIFKDKKDIDKETKIKSILEEIDKMEIRQLVEPTYLFNLITDRWLGEEGIDSKELINNIFNWIDKGDYKNKIKLKEIIYEIHVQASLYIEIKSRTERANNRIEEAKKDIIGIKDEVNKAKEDINKDIKVMKEDIHKAKEDIDKAEKKAKEEVEKKAENIRENIITQLVSLVGIFTTLAFLLFGGMSFLNELLVNFSGENEFKILFIASCWGLAFSSVFHLFIYFIFCMIGKEKENKKLILRTYLILVGILLVYIILYLIFIGIHI